jgi:hypothetical protein
MGDCILKVLFNMEKEQLSKILRQMRHKLKIDFGSTELTNIVYRYKINEMNTLILLVSILIILNNDIIGFSKFILNIENDSAPCLIKLKKLSIGYFGNEFDEEQFIEKVKTECNTYHQCSILNIP